MVYLKYVRLLEPAVETNANYGSDCYNDISHCKGSSYQCYEGGTSSNGSEGLGNHHLHMVPLQTSNDDADYDGKVVSLFGQTASRPYRKYIFIVSLIAVFCILLVTAVTIQRSVWHGVTDSTDVISGDDIIVFFSDDGTTDSADDTQVGVLGTDDEPVGNDDDDNPYIVIEDVEVRRRQSSPSPLTTQPYFPSHF